jgi:hypothetical protein
MPVSEADPVIEKWFAHAPEMRLLEVFCDPASRALVRCWGALLNEVDEATAELSNVAVAQAKLAWWGDELLHGARGAGRHPLVRALFSFDTARAIDANRWSDIVLAALATTQDESTPVDIDAVVGSGLPLAQAIAAVETSLLGSDPDAAGIAIGACVRALRRGLRAGGELRLRWPLTLVARHQQAQVDLRGSSDDSSARALVADYAQGLAARLRDAGGGNVLRQSRRLHDLHLLNGWTRSRLDRTEIPSLSSLWCHWRAARSARRSPA